MERQLLDAHRRLQHERTARWQHVRLGVEHRRVEALSTSDPLTGLHNRRFLDRLLSQVFDGTVPVCVAVIDLDGFKRINDDFGYLQGDRVLQDIAGVLTRVCRRNDAVARLGGDEFVMVLRDTSPGDARIVIDRLRGMVAARSFLGIPPDVRLTASVGIAVGSVAADTERVIADATEAMRDAKRTGRDRTCLR